MISYLLSHPYIIFAGIFLIVFALDIADMFKRKDKK